MAGTGYHPEGHVWKRTLAYGKFICLNCALIAHTDEERTRYDREGECIDDC